MATETIKRALYEDNWFVCCVCDMEKPSTKLRHDEAEPYKDYYPPDLPRSFANKLTVEEGIDAALRAQYDVSSFFPGTNMSDLLLSPRGVFQTTDDQQQIQYCVRVCLDCKTALRSTSNNNPPKFAIANKNFIGQLPISLRLRPAHATALEAAAVAANNPANEGEVWIAGSSETEVRLIKPMHTSQTTRKVVRAGWLDKRPDEERPGFEKYPR